MSTNSWELKEDASTSWANPIASSTISIFVREGSMDGIFQDVGPSTNKGALK